MKRKATEQPDLHPMPSGKQVRQYFQNNGKKLRLKEAKFADAYVGCRDCRAKRASKGRGIVFENPV